MTAETWKIDAIVEEVVRRLAAASPAAPAAGGDVATSGGLRVVDRVVTLASIDGRLAGVRRVVVSPAAVVTPAVVDALNERGIALVRASAGEGTGAGHAVVACRVEVPAAVRQACAGARFERAMDLDAAVAILRQALAPGAAQRAVLLTDRVADAVCRLNRVETIRAAAAWCADSVDDARRSAGTNALVAHPARCPGEVGAWLEGR